MSKHKIAPIYYPTTCLIVDDNKSFLKRMELHVGKDIICKTFSDPQEALQYIKKMSVNSSLTEKVMANTNSDDYLPASGNLPLRLNIHDLYKSAYDPICFSEISSVLVDFSMPTMNGIDFCKEIADSPIRKIMLTGEADETLAVKFFNEGNIDKFILKESQADLYISIKTSIKEIQTQYFQDIGSPIIQAIARDKESCLGDVAFIEFFDKFRHEISATNYYLIEPSGSFLFLDADGSPTWLIIKTQTELVDLANQMQDMDISEKLTNSVLNGDLIPYFQNFDHYMTVLENKTYIEKYLLPAKKLQGNKIYSYAVSKELFDFPLDRQKLMSFNNYILGL